jgi:hypothetical protein
MAVTPSTLQRAAFGLPLSPDELAPRARVPVGPLLRQPTSVLAIHCKHQSSPESTGFLCCGHGQHGRAGLSACFACADKYSATEIAANAESVCIDSVAGTYSTAEQQDSPIFATCFRVDSRPQSSHLAQPIRFHPMIHWLGASVQERLVFVQVLE